MQNNNLTATISAEAFSAMILAGISTNDKGDLCIAFPGVDVTNVQYYGLGFDGGQTASVLKGVKAAITGQFTKTDYLYLKNGMTSLREFRTSTIVRTGGDYAIGSDGLRAEVAKGDILWTSGPIFLGQVYRLIQEGRATKLHGLTAVNDGSGDMHEKAEYDSNARILIEGLDLIYMAYEEGRNICVKANKLGWKIEQIMEWVKTGDAKAAIEAHDAIGKEKGEFAKSVKRAVFVASHQDQYTTSYERTVETVKKYTSSTKITPESLLGRKVNYYKTADVAKTPVRKEAILIDSDEMAISYCAACANNGLTIVIVE